MKVISFSFLILWSLFLFADNRSDQINPNNDAYWESRGYDERPDDWEDLSSNNTYDYSEHELNNKSNQLNTNNDAYWQSRGYSERPDDWEDNQDNNPSENYSVHELNNRSNQLNPNNDIYWESRSNQNSNSIDKNDYTDDHTVEKESNSFQLLMHWLSIR